MSAEEKVTRKLKAFQSADAKGFSRLMGENGVGIYQRVTANLELIRSTIPSALCHVINPPFYRGGVSCEK